MNPCIVSGCAQPKLPGRGRRFCSRHRDEAEARSRLKATADARAWRERYPERYRETSLRYYERTADQQRARAAAWYRDNPERVQQYRERSKAKRLPRVGKYGLAVADYNAMLERQDGRCAICGRTENGKRHNFDVDHDHETGEVRGLLCNRCNRLLSNARDDLRILERAAGYLSRGAQAQVV